MRGDGTPAKLAEAEKWGKVAKFALHQAGLSVTTDGAAHSNFMSMHFEMSEPRPDEMMMQPRSFNALLSLAHTA